MQSARAAGLDEPPHNAVCATHPLQRASIACPFCGDFACASCTVDTDWGDALCEQCLAQGRAQYPLPWEQGPSPIAFAHTAYLVLADTRAMFAALPHGRIGRAASFALISALLAGTTALLLDWLFAPGHWATGTPAMSVLLLRSLLVQPLLLLGLSSAVAACLHAGAILLGGRAAFACAARATCYLSVIAVLDAASKVVAALAGDDALGFLRVLLLLAIAVAFGVRALGTVAERRYGLTRNRALIVAAVAFLAPTLAIRIAFELAAQLGAGAAN
jgi:hypothetical protein